MAGEIEIEVIEAAEVDGMLGAVFFRVDQGVSGQEILGAVVALEGGAFIGGGGGRAGEHEASEHEASRERKCLP